MLLNELDGLDWRGSSLENTDWTGKQDARNRKKIPAAGGTTLPLQRVNAVLGRLVEFVAKSPLADAKKLGCFAAMTVGSLQRTFDSNLFEPTEIEWECIWRNRYWNTFPGAFLAGPLLCTNG